MQNLYIELEEVVNCALRGCKNEYYFFNEEGIYTKVSSEEAKDLLNNIYTRGDGSRYFTLSTSVSCKINLNRLKKALGRTAVGTSFEEFKEIYEKTELEHHEKPKGLDRFITRIDNPRFSTVNSNYEKSKVFDYIHIDVGIITKWESDRKTYISSNRKEIISRILEKIKESRDFKKYGVPINVLRVTKMKYLEDGNIIECILELKELKNSDKSQPPERRENKSSNEKVM